jgi:hypothetical protein
MLKQFTTQKVKATQLGCDVTSDSGVTKVNTEAFSQDHEMRNAVWMDSTETGRGALLAVN